MTTTDPEDDDTDRASYDDLFPDEDGPHGDEGADDDYFGVCPECGKSDGCINIGRAHWFYCTEHKIRWCIGWNLFSGWQYETEDQQRETYERLDFGTFRTIEPDQAHPPRRAAAGGDTRGEVSGLPAERGLDVTLVADPHIPADHLGE